MRMGIRIYCDCCQKPYGYHNDLSSIISLPNAKCDLCKDCREKPEVKELLDRFRVDLFRIITKEAT